MLKIAKVTPVFKAGDRSSLGNYRPISVLPVFSKILEKIIYNRVYNFLNHHNALFPNQFGFQTNHSTEHAILKLVDNITKAFTEGKLTLGVFIDLSKAFDTVDHKILLQKLEMYGISGLTHQWFTSYLEDRKQSVAYDNGLLTKSTKISCGVPQGSILGPLLFLIYINDFHNCCTKLCPIMFANDTNLFYSDKNLENLFSTMNHDLTLVSQWFKANKLSLNIKKTNYTLFHRKNKTKLVQSELPQLTLDNIAIERKTVTKFLGILIDENLSWTPHISYINSKISKNIGILYKSREILNTNLRKQLYFSFIHSYITYANIIWASTHQTKLLSLLRHQKHAIRVVHFANRFAASKPLFEETKSLNVYEINVFQIICFMFRCKIKTTPQIFHKLFTLKPESKYELRGSGILKECLHRNKFSQFSISYRGPHLWNKIIAKEDISHDHTSLPIFRKKSKLVISKIENITQYF